MENMNVLIVGVGGQGSLLASRILGALFIGRGLDTKLSEVHGMSQRGGSVITYIRAGERIDSPLVSEGEADLVISFEALEGLRYAHYLKKGGTLVTSDQEIMPMPVVTGAAEYPKDIWERLNTYGIRVVRFDALAAAEKAGNPKAANVALLGAASHILGGTEEEWESIIRSTVPAKFADVNCKAFAFGANAAKIGD